jgi:hypothetical protein
MWTSFSGNVASSIHLSTKPGQVQGILVLAFIFSLGEEYG